MQKGAKGFPMRRVIVLIGAAVALAALGCVLYVRIACVNANAISIPEDRYSMGDEVALNGAFMTKANEGTDHYLVKVQGARKVSYNEYVSAYGVDGAQPIDGYDAKSVLDVEMEITNEGSDAGGLNAWEFVLIPESGNVYYIPSATLWAQSEPNLPPETGLITISPKTSHVVHIPFVQNEGFTDDTRFLGEIGGTSLTLRVADAPVSKVVVFNVDS